MKLALQYEMQRPTLDDHLVLEETMEQCVLADEVGFDSLWFVEHHFLTGFSASPCPEVILAALSQRTKQIRLGLGVVILPYHHPARVAERVAMLDHLSQGRVDFGTGRSAAYEVAGMGIDPQDTRDMWKESLTMIPKIWESDWFSWEGRYWQVPSRQVLPKPYQKPHPPHLGGRPSERHLRYRGREGHRGAGIRVQHPVQPRAPRACLQGEGAPVQSGGCRDQRPVGQRHAGHLPGEQPGGPGAGAPVHQDLLRPRQALRPAAEGRVQAAAGEVGGVPDHLRQNFSRYVELPDTEEHTLEDVLDLSGGAAIAQKLWEDMDPDTLCDRGIIIAGDPNSCIDALKKHEAIGIDQMLIMMQTETIPHDKVMKSIELFGRYIIPEFKSSEEVAADTAAESR